MHDIDTRLWDYFLSRQNYIQGENMRTNPKRRIPLSSTHKPVDTGYRFKPTNSFRKVVDSGYRQKIVY